MDKAVPAARLLLGLIFFVVGLNGFLNFLPPPEVPEAAAAYVGTLAGNVWFWYLLKSTETLCGFFLLVGRFVPLALTVLAPIAVNILAFHVFLAPSPAAIAVPILVWLLGLFLAHAYRSHFRGVLDANARPA